LASAKVTLADACAEPLQPLARYPKAENPSRRTALPSLNILIAGWIVGRYFQKQLGHAASGL
jgi:hypothetical protein